MRMRMSIMKMVITTLVLMKGALMVVALSDVVENEKELRPLAPFEVYIRNGLPQSSPNPLTIHCYSKDDDLGFHTLKPSQFFKWDFSMNLFSTTLYSCSFVWGSKKISFEVFNAYLTPKCENTLPAFYSTCTWRVTESAFYLDEVKLHVW